MHPKVIRDPVHDHIYFDRDKDKAVLALLECREVQRLRRIRQLGVSCFTYPGAEHSRFSHALGTCHLMNLALGYLERNQGLKLNELERTAALCAALLHDIGHGPFSHLLESYFCQEHEKWTVDLICNDETEVHQALKTQSEDLPKLVANIIMDKSNEELGWVCALVSSQLDVDRMDYLLRDSHFCGVPYGEFDHAWLFHTMRVENVPPHNLKQPVWREKAIRGIEEYLFARYYMYWNVYFHKTTRGYEELLRTIFKRAAKLRADDTIDVLSDPVNKFLAKESLSVPEYLLLDDALLTAQIGTWQHSNDNILADLCQRFLCRRGLKPVESKIPDGMLQASSRIDKIRDVLKEQGYDPDYYLSEDLAATQAYDYYHGEKGTAERTAKTAIQILSDSGEFTEISRHPYVPGLKAVTGQRAKRGMSYVPDECRDAVRKIIDGR
jgi:uncharacterized protein